MKLKKGDEVKIIRGKDKGKIGKIEKVFSKTKRVVIAGVNLYKRHLKTRSQSQPSEIITLTKPIALANLVLICSKCHLPTRIGFDMKGNEKLRVCKKCRQAI